MPTLVDTSVLIDALRGHPSALEYLSETRRADAVVSVTPVRTEILGGVLDGEVRRTFDVLRLIHWLDVTVELADVAGALRRQFHRGRSGIDTVDYLLAAATIQLGGRLATQNVRDFPMFSGLQRPY
jgi:predicted nucleic acid-binding protein